MIGSEQYNLRLSQQRADTLKQFLISLGVESKAISKVNGWGEIEIADTNDLESKRRISRRVDLILTQVLDSAWGRQKIANKKVGDKLSMDQILFDTGSCSISKESIPTLDSLLSLLRINNTVTFKIEGHVCCTSRGIDDLDKKTGILNLSKVRAQTVYQYLIKRGIEPTRPTYTGYGSDVPTGKGMREDRRVEVVITGIY